MLARALRAARRRFRLGVDHSDLPARAGRAPPRHGHLLRARLTSRRAVPLGALALEELNRRRPGDAFVLFGDGAGRLGVPLRAARGRRAGAARAALLRGDRGALPVADQLLADPAGDDGLRPAVRRPARGEHGVRAGADGPWSSRSAIPWRWRTRSSACWTTRPRWERRSGRARVLAEPRPGTSRRQVEAGLRAALRREREAAIVAMSHARYRTLWSRTWKGRPSSAAAAPTGATYGGDLQSQCPSRPHCCQVAAGRAPRSCSCSLSRCCAACSSRSHPALLGAGRGLPLPLRGVPDDAARAPGSQQAHVSARVPVGGQAINYDAYCCRTRPTGSSAATRRRR